MKFNVLNILIIWTVAQSQNFSGKNCNNLANVGLFSFVCLRFNLLRIKVNNDTILVRMGFPKMYLVAVSHQSNCK